MPLTHQHKLLATRAMNIHRSKINSVRWMICSLWSSLCCVVRCVLCFFFLYRFCLLLFFPICLRLEFLLKQSLQWFTQRGKKREKEHTTQHSINEREPFECMCAIEILQRQFSGDDFRFALLWFRITHERTCLRCAFSTLRFGSYAKRS